MDAVEVTVAPSRQRERELERQRRIRQAQRREAARRRARRRTVVVASVLAVVLLISVVALLANGTGSGTKATPAATPSASASPSASAAFLPVPAGADPRLKTKPTVTLPKAAPTKLVKRDLIVGTGAVAKSGEQVTVNYVGVGYPGGKEFDSSWASRTPLLFRLGTGAVIKGWDQGIVGMKVGGRRELVVPPALGYGATGQPPDIKANEPLVFVVDLLAVG